MIGWVISLGMLLSGLIHNNTIVIITSGLFAIAGSIGYGFLTLTTGLKNMKASGTNNS